MNEFQKICVECESIENIETCLHCKKPVCSHCQHYLVANEETPKWFIGKEVKSLEEYKVLNIMYANLLRTKKVQIHCCNEYVVKHWEEMKKQMLEFAGDSQETGGAIRLR